MDFLDGAEQVGKVVGQVRQNFFGEVGFPVGAGSGQSAGEIVDLLI